LTDRAVANSTCLIALERIGHLHLLSRVFAEVVAPPAVRAELGVAPEWLKVQPPSDRAVVAALATQLGEGEASAIALAMERGDAWLVLDDKKARRVARQLGLRLIGTVGVLLQAKQRGAVPTIGPLLGALRDAGFRLSPALEREALRLAGEHA
jgi:predicted nucleic acid-binding protein